MDLTRVMPIVVMISRIFPHQFVKKKDYTHYINAII